MNKSGSTMRRSSRALRLASGRAGGFTLVEMLVAVGAVAFVAVGIASIFASVGDTVSRGRSVSALTQYAAVLERQMREDFAAITRDGFMIIRHEEADGGASVPLYPDQPIGQWRERRVDEIVFFVNKPSQSAREPLAPGFVPEGSSARIYYGIGQRMNEADPRFARPDVVDTNRTGDFLGVARAGNPNRFAQDWTLLRHETALVSPGGGLTDAPNLPYPPAVWRDNRLQIGLQPAAESIFRSINELNVTSCTGIFPSVATVRDRSGASSASPDQSPLFESGLVDVATTNLAEIRGIVTSSAGFRDSDPDPYTLTPPYTFISPTQLTNCADYFGPGPVVGPVGMQQAWMLDALPAPSHPIEIDFTGAFAVGAEVGSAAYRFVNVPVTERARMRYEPAPPDIHPAYVLQSNPATATRGAIRLADQYALAASAFVPRTTEFIVEWSFGKLDDDGRLIWHGAERTFDADRDGTDDQFVFPYPRYGEEVRGTRADLAGSFFVPYRLAQPAMAGDPGVGNRPREFTGLPRLGTTWFNQLQGNFADAGDEYGSYPVLPEVVHGVTGSSLGGAGNVPLVSYFGYTLPFFNPDDPDRDGDEADAAAQDTLEWPWPELVRVTVTLADPGDETIERTFQFVFPTPGNPVR